MKTKNTKRRTRELPRTSPAVHFLRPIFLAIAGLLVYGGYRQNLPILFSAAAIGFVALLPALALHAGYRRKQEQRKKVYCG